MDIQYEKMTEEGKNKLISDINKLKEQLASLCLSATNYEMKESRDMQSVEIARTVLRNQIISLETRLNFVEVIDVEELETNQVNIGDTLNVNMVYDKDDLESYTFTLVGTEGNSLKNQISVNSPLGSAVYKKKIGDVVSFQVNGITTNVEIIEKVIKEKDIEMTIN